MDNINQNSDQLDFSKLINSLLRQKWLIVISTSIITLLVVLYLLTLKPKRIIFNPGTENKGFEKRLRDAGIETEQSCTLVLLATNQY